MTRGDASAPPATPFGPTNGPSAKASGDDVEAALVKALDRAAEAGRFDVVSQLARELEARRLSRAGNVVRLDEERSRKNR